MDGLGGRRHPLERCGGGLLVSVGSVGCGPDPRDRGDMSQAELCGEPMGKVRLEGRRVKVLCPLETTEKGAPLCPVGMASASLLQRKL